jgi:DNA polymerase/3'-5' exonuclease PolX
VINSGVLKDTPQKLAFYIDYSNAIYAGEIGPGKKESKEKTEKLAKKHCVRNPVDYFRKLKNQIDDTGRLNRKKRTIDMMILEKPGSAKMRQALEKFAVKEKFKFTNAMAEHHLRVKCGFGRGCSARSISRFINNPKNKWKQVYEGTVPLLKQRHLRARKVYARDRLKEGDDRWVDHFDVDEKWFYGYAHGQKCKVPPGHKRPKKPLQSKHNIPKVMFLAATALPRPDKGFDGKIGFFRVFEMKTAQRTSKYHAKGDKYEMDVTMDADKYREMMVKKVFPAARRKMPWAKTLRCQQDGAGAHTGKDNVNKLNTAGARGKRAKITVFTQPAQSPDTNINDLAIFPSMSKHFNTKQKHEVISDLDRLAVNARKTWDEFPVDVLTKAWATKTLVLKAIVKADGGNSFKLPHSKDLEDFDWEAMCEDWEDEP